MALKPELSAAEGGNALRKRDERVDSVKCPRCRSRDLVTIGMSVAGENVVLKSCSACDVRWWEGAGQRLELSSVLELAAIPKR